MSINFTGIKNTGYLRNINSVKNVENEFFFTMLTDDNTGNDFFEYETVLKKTGLRYNPWDNNMVSLYIKKRYPESEFEDSKYEFYLNARPLYVNDKNMKMFQFLTKMTNKIIEKDDDEIIVNKNFLDSDDLRYGMIPRFDLAEMLKGCDYKASINYLFNKQVAKKGAQDINDCIKDAMNQYFA